MPTFRFTLPTRYGPGTPGFRDPAARQGHYADGADANEAMRVVHRRLANAGDLRPDERIELDQRRVPWHD